MPGRRYSANEIAEKLKQADALSVKGKPQADIARAIGVSLMTYYRWRKEHDKAEQPSAADLPQMNLDRANRIAELRTENETLRRIAADLLIEKTSLQDQLANKRLKNGTSD